MPGLELEKIVSGGQTGVDRAALDAAIAAGIAIGGWCPKGRRAEDGRISKDYPLEETPTEDYAERTLWNVRDTDATLVLTQGEPEGGTALTISFARELRKPHLIVDLDQGTSTDLTVLWLTDGDFKVLNVAGPRASKDKTIYKAAHAFLADLLETLKTKV